jgi:hypothetical protein
MQNDTLAHVRDAAHALAHLSDAVLLRELASLVAQDRVTTATLLAHIAEVDARRLYVPAGYPSMHAYCVDELRLSEESALRRIQAARAGRRFPVLFEALAGGRLHLTAVCLLAPHLTQENADELIEAATHRRKFEIEELLARRFPPPVAPLLVRPVTPLVFEPQHSLANVEHAPANVESDVSARVGARDERSLANVVHPQVKVPPHSEGCFLVQLTIAKSTHDKLRYAQALLSHALPTGDIAQVFDRALDTLIAQLEKRKFGSITRWPRRQRSKPPSVSGRTTSRKRYVPTHVRRAVWERDQGQCTFVSASGHRCKARRFLEFDHADPVARGGRGTVDRVRLRCRAHNQYEAERTFGAGFMSRKRHESQLAVAQARGQAAAKEQFQDVLAGLRSLGCGANEARCAAEFSETFPGATLEERMRAALKFLSRSCKVSVTGPTGTRLPAGAPERS